MEAKKEMKEVYEAPKAEIVVYNGADIICTSGCQGIMIECEYDE